MRKASLQAEYNQSYAHSFFGSIHLIIDTCIFKTSSQSESHVWKSCWR